MIDSSLSCGEGRTRSACCMLHRGRTHRTLKSLMGGQPGPLLCASLDFKENSSALYVPLIKKCSHFIIGSHDHPFVGQHRRLTPNTWILFAEKGRVNPKSRILPTLLPGCDNQLRHLLLWAGLPHARCFSPNRLYISWSQRFCFPHGDTMSLLLLLN